MDTVLDCIGSLRRNGSAVHVGALAENKVPIEYGTFVNDNISITGSVWYNNKSVLELMNMAAGGTLNFDYYDTHTFPLDQVNEALEFAAQRLGVCTNVVVRPNL